MSHDSDHHRRDRRLRWIFGAYAIVWTATAIAPSSREAWLLENLIPVPFVLALVLTRRRFRFSFSAYVQMAVFLMLHAFGAATTYADSPVGAWMAEVLGLERNHFDRIVHFSFGALMSIPCRELVVRVTRVRPGWATRTTILVMIAASTVYELIESWTARILRPELGAAFLGAQGDRWDAQKDMTAALVGSLIAFAVSAAWRALAARRR